MKNKYLINGTVTTIYLPRRDGTRLEMLIDTIDLPIMMELDTITWYGTFQKSTQSYYAQAHIPGTKQGKMYFHRWITVAAPGMDVDHINHNTLDNRRSVNLRAVTRSENMLNQKKRKLINERNESGIRVRFHKKAKKWEANASINGKVKYIGLFREKQDAIEAAKTARKETA